MPIVHNSAGKVVVVPTLPKQVLLPVQFVFIFHLPSIKNVSTLMFHRPVFYPHCNLSLKRLVLLWVVPWRNLWLPGHSFTVLRKWTYRWKSLTKGLCFLPFGNISKIHLWEIVVSTGRWACKLTGFWAPCRIAHSKRIAIIRLHSEDWVCCFRCCWEAQGFHGAWLWLLLQKPRSTSKVSSWPTTSLICCVNHHAYSYEGTHCVPLWSQLFLPQLEKTRKES